MDFFQPILYRIIGFQSVGFSMFFRPDFLTPLAMSHDHHLTRFIPRISLDHFAISPNPFLFGSFIPDSSPPNDPVPRYPLMFLGKTRSDQRPKSRALKD